METVVSRVNKCSKVLVGNAHSEGESFYFGARALFGFYHFQTMVISNQRAVGCQEPSRKLAAFLV